MDFDTVLRGAVPCLSAFPGGLSRLPHCAHLLCPRLPRSPLAPAGTSAGTSFSLLMEPGFVSQQAGGDDGAQRRPSLYFALPNCTALSDSDRDTLQQIGQVGRALLSKHSSCCLGAAVGGCRGERRETAACLSSSSLQALACPLPRPLLPRRTPWVANATFLQPTPPHCHNVCTVEPLPTTLPASPVLTTRLLLLLLSQAITNMTGFPVDCASLPPAWQADAGWLNDQVCVWVCGCVGVGGVGGGGGVWGGGAAVLDCHACAWVG
jgi:hypothetical protein